MSDYIKMAWISCSLHCSTTQAGNIYYNSLSIFGVSLQI